MTADFLLDPDGDLPLNSRTLRTATEDHRVLKQRIRFYLERARGEDPIDLRKGLPVIQWRAEKPPPLEAIRAFVRTGILSIPEVDEVQLEVSLDRDTRTVSISGTVIDLSGDELPFEVPSLLGRPDQNTQPWVIFQKRRL